MGALLIDDALDHPVLSDAALDILAVVNPVGAIKTLLVQDASSPRLYLPWEAIGRLARLDRGGLKVLTALRDLSYIHLWQTYRTLAREGLKRLRWATPEWRDDPDAESPWPFRADFIVLDRRPEIPDFPTGWVPRWEVRARQQDMGHAFMAWRGIKPSKRFADGSSGAARATLIGVILGTLPEIDPPSPPLEQA